MTTSKGITSLVPNANNDDVNRFMRKWSFDRLRILSNKEGETVVAIVRGGLHCLYH